MSVKLLALGNVLMEDDGIAVYVAANLEEKLRKLGIEVIYGETDIGYSIARIDREDFVIILDAASLGKEAGDITILPLEALSAEKGDMSLHSISFLDLFKLYFPENKGVVIAVEIEEVSFQYGLGRILTDKLTLITQEIYRKLNECLYHMEASEK